MKAILKKSNPSKEDFAILTNILIDIFKIDDF
jgi:hypothetical protein